MHRQDLLELLTKYNPEDAHEIYCKQQMLDLLNQHADCFERSCLPGHFTASCWLLSYDGNSALLTHHVKLQKWLQLGGHCDGDSNLLRVALKEAQEESGLTNIKVVSTEIFDIDVHHIPAYKNEPAHLHFDVRFLLQAADNAPLIISSESKDLQWFDCDYSKLPTQQTSVTRMFFKWQKFRAGVFKSSPAIQTL